MRDWSKKIARRSKRDLEFELIDTGIFDENRYFDVFVEYAKGGPDDIFDPASKRSTAVPNAAELHLFPTMWFRNTWSWGLDERRPRLRRDVSAEVAAVKLDHYYYGSRWLYCEGGPELLFTENETNTASFSMRKMHSPYVKDGINDYIVHGIKTAVNPEPAGTKAAAHYAAASPPGKSSPYGSGLRLFHRTSGKPLDGEFDEIFASRRTEADEFYRTVIPDVRDRRNNIMRQALGGLLWSKQFYHYDVNRWLKGDPAGPEPPRERLKGRNRNGAISTMPT